MPGIRDVHRIDAVSRRLATFSPDGDVWDDALEELRELFGADGALAYRVAKAEAGWEFEFLHKSLAPDPEARKTFGVFQRFVLATAKPWPAYNPERPARWQRNRALTEQQLSGGPGQPSRLAKLYELMGSSWKDPDQVRVLVCDGPRMLAWVGVVKKSRFHSRAADHLQRLVPALRARLSIDELVRDRARHRATLDAAFDAVGAPCLLVDRFGRVEHANEPARLLESHRPELFEAARRAATTPDWRCEVRKVETRGAPSAFLVIVRPSEQGDRLERAARHWNLTPRQRAVVELVATGLGNKQVAERLGISEGTVELHMTTILRKANAESRAELVARYWTVP